MQYKKVLIYKGDNKVPYSPYVLGQVSVWNKVSKTSVTWTKIVKPPLTKQILVNE